MSEIPVVHTIDLMVDGSGGVLVPSTAKFYAISEAVITMRFLTRQFDCEKFADGPPLDGGFFLVYKGNHLGSENPIRSNKDLHLYGYDVGMMEHPASGSSPSLWERIRGTYLRTQVICAHWHFHNWMPNGLGMWDSQDYFGVMLNDDLTDIECLLDLKCTLLGWDLHA